MLLAAPAIFGYGPTAGEGVLCHPTTIGKNGLDVDVTAFDAPVRVSDLSGL